MDLSQEATDYDILDGFLRDMTTSEPVVPGTLPKSPYTKKHVKVFTSVVQFFNQHEQGVQIAAEYVGYLGKTLMDLPHDIILLIIKSLDFPTFVATLALTKKWFEVSKSEFLATHFFLDAQHKLATGKR